MSVTIVAIPAERDYTWRLSSEEIPHLTILQLGEVSDPSEVAQYVMHVAETTMYTFGLKVKRRGTLGAKEADVLFFDQSYCKMVEQARSYLLQNDDIRKAYDSVEQFPEWTPHLTMGYPEDPAKEDTRDYPGIDWVEFDKLAIWFDDYEGPEILLKDQYSWSGEVGMSDDQFMSEFLSHFGVRGMKWGIRRSKTTKSSGGESADFRSAASAAVKAKKGGAKALSNAELKTLIERMNLERQYSSLAPPSKAARYSKAGGKFVADVLVGVGKTQATKLVNDQATKYIGTIIKTGAKG